MTIKQDTVFDRIKILRKKGMSIKEAIEEIESVLHTQLPEHITILIKDEK